MSRDKLQLDYRISNADAAYTWQYRDIDLSVARDNVELELSGDFLQAPVDAFDAETTVSTTKTVGEVFVRFDSKDGNPYLVKGGAVVSMKRAPFGKLFITNAAQAGKMIRIYTSALADSQPQAREIELTTDSIANLEPNKSDNAIGTTAAVIVSARAARKSLLIQNVDTTLDLVILGTDNTKAADDGAVVSANGGVYTIDNFTGAVYGITASGTIVAANIRVIEGY